MVTSKTKYRISDEDIKSYLDYMPETGKFIWKARPDTTRGNRNFNTRFAGKEAGGLSEGHGDGYLRIRVKGLMIKAHRLAFLFMEDKWPEQYVDHINGDKQDNRWCNLRLADKKTNGRNQRLYANNKSGYPGVYWLRHKSKWAVQIGGSGENREFLGNYDTKFEAMCIRKARELELDYHDNHGRVRG